jgi:hypothetical protein
MGRNREILVKAFIREATEDDSFAMVADVATIYNTLRTLQTGKYSVTTENGTTFVSSQVGDEAFTFHVPGELSPEGIVAIAEEALELIEGLTRHWGSP